MSVPVTSGEGQTTAVWIPLLEPARYDAAPIFQTSVRDAPIPRPSTSARGVTVPNSRTTVEDVPISQVPTNDTPDTKSLVDVHISKPRLKPPGPDDYKVAPDSL